MGDIMENNEYVGFDSVEEAKLYETICMCHLFKKSEKEGYDFLITKDECLQIIKKYHLENLFNSIKNLNYLDSLKHLYSYYYNLLLDYDSKREMATINISNLWYMIDINEFCNPKKASYKEISRVLLELIRSFNEEEDKNYYKVWLLNQILCEIDFNTFYLSPEDQKEFENYKLKLINHPGKTRNKEDEEENYQ